MRVFTVVKPVALGAVQSSPDQAVPTLGEQEWHSGESALLPPMCLEIDYRCLLVLFLTPRDFSGFCGFLPQLKSTLQTSNSSRKQWMKLLNEWVRFSVIKLSSLFLSIGKTNKWTTTTKKQNTCCWLLTFYFSLHYRCAFISSSRKWEYWIFVNQKSRWFENLEERSRFLWRKLTFNEQNWFHDFLFSMYWLQGIPIY